VKRRLIFADGKSDKFWEVEVIGAGLRVRFGRRGGAGQTQDKSFPSPDAARVAAGKLIGEKLAKGYRDDDTTPVDAAHAVSVASAPGPASPPSPPSSIEAEVTRHGDLIVEAGKRVELAGGAVVMGWIEVRGELVCDGDLTCLGIVVEGSGRLRCRQLVANLIEVDNGRANPGVRAPGVQVELERAQARVVTLVQVAASLGLCQPFADRVEDGAVVADYIEHHGGALNPSWDYERGDASILSGEEIDVRAAILAGENPFVGRSLLVERRSRPASGRPEPAHPLLDELRAWIAAHPGPQRALAHELRDTWLARLIDAEAAVRAAAGKTIERALRSPKLSAERDALLAALAASASG